MARLQCVYVSVGRITWTLSSRGTNPVCNADDRPAGRATTLAASDFNVNSISVDDGRLGAIRFKNLCKEMRAH